MTRHEAGEAGEAGGAEGAKPSLGWAVLGWARPLAALGWARPLARTEWRREGKPATGSRPRTRWRWWWVTSSRDTEEVKC